jgi:hypothetical protein
MTDDDERSRQRHAAGMAKIAARIDELVGRSRIERTLDAAHEERKRAFHESIRDGTDPVVAGLLADRKTPHAFVRERVRHIRLPNFCTTCGLLKDHPVHAQRDASEQVRP